MTKQLKRILIALLVLVILGGALAVLYFLPKSPSKTTSSGAASSSTSIALTSVDQSTIQQLHVKNANGEYTIVKNADNSYSVKELAAAPYYNADVASAIGSAANITVSQVIEQNATNLTEYGLDNPTTTVDVTVSGGKTYTVLYGAASPGGTGTYVQLKGSNTVYLLTGDITSYFTYAPLQFINTNLLTIDTANYGKLTSMEFGGTGRAEPIKLAVDKSIAATADGWYNFKMTAPRTYELDTSKVSTITTALPTITADDVVSIDTSAANLDKYGLTTPKYTFSLTCNGESYTFNFGNTVTDNGSEYVYTMLSGRNVIYRISTSTLSFYNWQFIDLVNRVLISADINTVKDVVLEYKGQKYVYNIAGTDTNLTVKYNNKALNVDNFRNYYFEIISVTIQGQAPRPPAQDPLLKVTIDFRDSTKKSIVATYTTINDRQAFDDINGNGDFYVTKPAIDKIISDAAVVAANKTIVQY